MAIRAWGSSDSYVNHEPYQANPLVGLFVCLIFAMDTSFTGAKRIKKQGLTLPDRRSG